MQLTFDLPLSGLARLTEYDLQPLAGAAGLFTLRSLERPEIRLFLLDPEVYVPGYRPALPEDRPGDQVLVIATPREDGPMVNLLAPIVVDIERGRGRQIVVSDDLERLRVPLTPAAPAA